MLRIVLEGDLSSAREICFQRTIFLNFQHYRKENTSRNGRTKKHFHQFLKILQNEQNFIAARVSSLKSKTTRAKLDRFRIFCLTCIEHVACSKYLASDSTMRRSAGNGTNTSQGDNGGKAMVRPSQKRHDTQSKSQRNKATKFLCFAPNVDECDFANGMILANVTP